MNVSPSRLFLLSAAFFVGGLLLACMGWIRPELLAQLAQVGRAAT